MPISPSDETHTKEHWIAVKGVISEAIANAGCKAQPVWESGAHDIIQAKILQNIFENPIVVCDLSTRNPNVMLEMGMRLTTKKPTLLIAEEGTPLPFDTGIIHTEFYPSNLAYAPTSKFIDTLSGQISEKLKAWEAGTYNPYLAAFEFETVEPSQVTVTAEERLTDLVARMSENVENFERTISRERSFDNALASWAERKGFAPHADVKPLNALNAFSATEATADTRLGATVFHAKFGEGKVVFVDGAKITVDFAEAGQRRVIDTFLEWHKTE